MPKDVEQRLKPAEYLYGQELDDRRIALQGIGELLGLSPKHEPWLKGEYFLVSQDSEEINGSYSDLWSDLDYVYGDAAAEKFPDTSKIKEHIKKRRRRILSSAEQREPELERGKERFAAKAEAFIAAGVIPLTREQLSDRLKTVRLGFSDWWNSIEDDVAARYYCVDNSLRIASTFQTRRQQPFDRIIFHEMLHAISGQRIIKDDSVDGIEPRRIGLCLDPYRRKNWLNEAITEAITRLMTAGETVESFDLAEPLPIVLESEEGQRLEGYNAELKVASLVLGQIPARTLLRAYFAQDNDCFEDDPRAGIHAERELWRAIKTAYGCERIKELRNFEDGFQDNKSKRKSIKLANMLSCRHRSS